MGAKDSKNAFIILDLDPANWYNLRVTAHNNAGFSVAEYEFATLTITGGKDYYHLFCSLFYIILLCPKLKNISNENLFKTNEKKLCPNTQVK